MQQELRRIFTWRKDRKSPENEHSVDVRGRELYLIRKEVYLFMPIFVLGDPSTH